MTWPESVDEALCYGWIDGVRRSLGEASYTIRFTPRKTKSTWSSVNIKRVAERTALKRMVASGLAAFERRDPARSEIYACEHKARGLAAAAEAALRRIPEAWAFWNAQRPSYRRIAGNWAVSAKRETARRPAEEAELTGAPRCLSSSSMPRSPRRSPS